jgi:hypothetical protein
MNTMIHLRDRGSNIDTSWMDVDVSTRGVWLRPASWVSETSGIEYRVFAWSGTEAGLEIPPAADASRGWAGPAVFMPISQVYDYLTENGHYGSAGNMISDIMWAARKAEKSAPWESAVKKAELVNLTPHSITIRAEDGTETTIPPSGTVARVSTTDEAVGTCPITGAPIVRRVFGDVTGLPAEGTPCIVSALVLSAVPGRAGIYAPDTGPTAIRNDAGQIIAVTRLVAA